MEFSSKQDAILKEAIEFYGYDNQKDMIHEEIGELLLAFSKYKRNPTAKRLNNLHEELADVKILIRQFEHFFGPENIEKNILFKIDRLRTRLIFKQQLRHLEIKIGHLISNLYPSPIFLNLDQLVALVSEEEKNEAWKNALKKINIKGVDFSNVSGNENLATLLNTWAHYYNLSKE
ncbi:hypothetical protein [Flavobacterium sp.]|uniref:hypothetical protein n=1 Tax=Flavobacterium sp. TaxID=239 RepID=UPI003D6BEEB1